MKITLRFTLLFSLLLAIILNPVSAESTTVDGIDFTALDTVINAQMSKHGIPGAALAVIENDQVVYLKGYGTDGSGRPMTPQTHMYIGSQSKSFTALAIAQLAEQGKLDLDAAVQNYIPWFRIADETASHQITIDHLLHHTSGLSDAGYGVLLPDNATLEQAVRSLAGAELTAPIGTKHQYFNMGYSVLTYLVELTSGQSYADYIQEHILDPLEMKSSTADPSLLAGDMASGYTRLFGFALPAHENIQAYAVGAGYIVSTAEDLARYTIAFQTRDERLVSPTMLKRILTPGAGSYGMGWYIVDNGDKIFHGGANQTFRTEVNFYPASHRAFVLLTNMGYQVDHFISAGQLTNAVEAVVLGKPHQPSRRAGR